MSSALILSVLCCRSETDSGEELQGFTETVKYLSSSSMHVVAIRRRISNGEFKYCRTISCLRLCTGIQRRSVLHWQTNCFVAFCLHAPSRRKTAASTLERSRRQPSHDVAKNWATVQRSSAGRMESDAAVVPYK